MGAKTWMVAYSTGSIPAIIKARPSLNRQASAALARKLFSSHSLRELDDGSLAFTNPPDDEIMVGCYPGVVFIAAAEFAIDLPSTLPLNFRNAELGETLYLHAMHSVVDWFAFAVWQSGK